MEREADRGGCARPAAAAACRDHLTEEREERTGTMSCNWGAELWVRELVSAESGVPVPERSAPNRAVHHSLCTGEGLVLLAALP